VTENIATYVPTLARNCVRRASGLVLTPKARIGVHRKHRLGEKLLLATAPLCRRPDLYGPVRQVNFSLIRTRRLRPSRMSLALGIGANTTIYSFMESILLGSLTVADPESLVILNWHSRPPRDGGTFTYY